MKFKKIAKENLITREFFSDKILSEMEREAKHELFDAFLEGNKTLAEEGEEDGKLYLVRFTKRYDEKIETRQIKQTMMMEFKKLTMKDLEDMLLEACENGFNSL